jgi:Flp pilus assembly protein protease CpaA
MMAGAVFGIIVIVWRSVRPILELHIVQFLSLANSGAQATSVSHALRRQNGATEIPYAPAIAVGTFAALWYIGYLPRQFLG